MAKKTVADASAELYKLLEPFTFEERSRLVRGTLTLLGEAADAAEDASSARGGGIPSAVSGSGAAASKGARAYLDHKSPQSKIEELATVARYCETTGGGSSLQKGKFEGVFREARRNFDGTHFARDLDNARNAGFFNKGGSAKAGYTLSYYGQNYVDALPDRAAAKAIKRPKGSSKGKTKAKRTKVST